MSPSILPVEGFAALCELCDWTGPIRSDSLKAANDFDRHLTGGTHTGKRLAQPVPGDLVVLDDRVGRDLGTVTVVDLESTADAPDSFEVRANDGNAYRVIRSTGVAREWYAV